MVLLSQDISARHKLFQQLIDMSFLGIILTQSWMLRTPGGGGGGGGALGQVSYGGVQLRGLNPYPILGKAGLRKHTLI